MSIEFVPITSSNLSGAYHDGDDLFLQFKNGLVYRYADVPVSIYDQLLSAESAGKFFHAYIRGQYEETKLQG